VKIFSSCISSFKYYFNDFFLNSNNVHGPSVKP
jgi:hypothetical protein